MRATKAQKNRVVHQIYRAVNISIWFQFLQFCHEMWEKALQRPLVKLNSNLFRPANFANWSGFGQVMTNGLKRRVEFKYFAVKFLRNNTEMWEKALQRQLVKLNSNLFRPANFANWSSFGQVMKMAQKRRVKFLFIAKFLHILDSPNSRKGSSKREKLGPFTRVSPDNLNVTVPFKTAPPSHNGLDGVLESSFRVHVV